MNEILLKLTSLSPELKKVLEVEEVKKQIENIEFKELSIFTDKDIAEIKANTKRDALQEGQKAIIDTTIKDLKLEGSFDSIKSIVEASNKMAIENAKIPVDKKVSELESQLKTAQNSIVDFEKKLTGKDTEIQGIKVNSIIYSKLPKDIPGGLTKEEAVQILKMGADPVFENGKYYPVVNNQKLQDDKGNHIEYDAFINSKIEQKGWLAPPKNDGKGGDHKPGGDGTVKSISDISNLTEYNEYLQSKGIEKGNGIKAQSILAKAMENKDFKMD